MMKVTVFSRNSATDKVTSVAGLALEHGDGQARVTTGHAKDAVQLPFLTEGSVEQTRRLNRWCVPVDVELDEAAEAPPVQEVGPETFPDETPEPVPVEEVSESPGSPVGAGDDEDEEDDETDS